MKIAIRNGYKYLIITFVDKNYVEYKKKLKFMFTFFTNVLCGKIVA